MIHIGFAKAASTSLQAWFTARPDIAFTADGLGGFGGGFALANQSAEQSTTPALYVTSAEAFALPLAPSATGQLAVSDREAQQRVCDVLRTLFADPLILIITRGFQGTIAAGASQYVRQGGVLSVSRLARWYSEPEMIAGADALAYDRVVRIYEQAFGAESVIVLPYELLVDDPHRFLNILEDRLGVAHREIPIPRTNVGLTSAELHWYPRFSRAAILIERYLGRPGRRFAATYRTHIIAPTGSVKARWLASTLARIIKEPEVDLKAIVPDATIVGCVEHAVRLIQRPEYAAYVSAYQAPGSANEPAIDYQR